MKNFKSLALLVVLSVQPALSFGATDSTATDTKVPSVRCTDASSDMSPESFYYISSDAVGSLVTINGEAYQVISLDAGYHDDIFMDLVSVQSVQYPKAGPTDIVCF